MPAVARTKTPITSRGSPPAIWSAFARASAYKTWLIASELAVIVLLSVANIRLGRREPDVVVIGPNGKGTYVERSVASAALLAFVADQKQVPSDVTVIHFTKDLVRLAFAVNSSTFEESWGEALSLMSEPLRAKLSEESKAQRLVETYRLARVETALTVDDLTLVERTGALVHVRAALSRVKRPMAGGEGSSSSDRLSVDLVLRTVPRTMARPDGLEVAEMRVSVVPPESSNPVSSTQRAP
jgi:hypothetical protein